MDIKQAYNIWADQYDSNNNKTRDMEAVALRNTLACFSFNQCLEIGCGTGKNTGWLVTKAASITAVDFSDEMLAQASAKTKTVGVKFIQADVTKEWSFAEAGYDLITFSLVLEHIEKLEHIFAEVAKVLKPGGLVYIGELHPSKQYSGSKARFETTEGTQIVHCFNHNVSDFIEAAKQNELLLADLNEYFDDGNRATLPRILTIVFKKSNTA
jgi:ubiquinone/menaquinone biosynthesis C-methylase UbiE